MFILDEIDLNFHLSARNIPNVEVATVKEINPVLLLRSEKVVIVPEAFKLIEDDDGPLALWELGNSDEQLAPSLFC